MKRILIAAVFIFSGYFSVSAQTDSTIVAEKLCPTVSINLAPKDDPADPKIFLASAEIGGAANWKFEIKWTVTGGKIIEGQGTSLIKIEPYFNKGDAKVVTVLELIGLDKSCDNKSRAGVNIHIDPLEPLSATLENRYEVVSNEIRKERLDNYAIELQSEPNVAGFLAIKINKLTNQQARNYLAKVFNYLVNNRGIDARRLFFSVSTGNDDLIELYLVPPGATFPALSEKHTIIKGEDLIKKP